jgi:hypothetical protein
MKSDVEAENIKFYLLLEKWESSEIIIRINFTEPLIVSKGM